VVLYHFGLKRGVGTETMSVEALAMVPEEEVWLASRKRAHAPGVP
jgi:hypothetical protein